MSFCLAFVGVFQYFMWCSIWTAA